MRATDVPHNCLHTSSRTAYETSLMHGSRSGCLRASLHAANAQPNVPYAPNERGTKFQAPTILRNGVCISSHRSSLHQHPGALRTSVLAPGICDNARHGCSCHPSQVGGGGHSASDCPHIIAPRPCEQVSSPRGSANIFARKAPERGATPRFYSNTLGLTGGGAHRDRVSSDDYPGAVRIEYSRPTPPLVFASPPRLLRQHPRAKGGWALSERVFSEQNSRAV
jgi:hypothetical protein